jgi:hypothetical protein
MWRVERFVLVLDLLWTWQLFCMYLRVTLALWGRQMSEPGISTYQGFVKGLIWRVRIVLGVTGIGGLILEGQSHQRIICCDCCEYSYRFQCSKRLGI